MSDPDVPPGASRASGPSASPAEPSQGGSPKPGPPQTSPPQAGPSPGQPSQAGPPQAGASRTDPSRALWSSPLRMPSPPPEPLAPLPSPEPPSGFGRLPIRRWVLIAGAVFAVFLVVATLVTVVTLEQTRQARDGLVDVIDPATLHSLEKATAFTRQESAVRGYVLTGNERYRQLYAEARRDEDAAMAAIAALLPRLPAGATQEDAARLREYSDRWHRDYAAPVISGSMTADPAVGERLFAPILDTLKRQQDELKRLHAMGKERLNYGWRTFYYVLAVLVLVLVGTAIAFALLIRFAVLRPVSQLSEQVRAVAGGDFEHQLAVGRPAELADLSARVDAMRHRMLGEWRRSAQAQQRLSEQTLELRRSNAELEQFAYVASHDLQEPLRKIASFTQMLEQRYGEHLDDRAKQYIKFAVDGAKRMQMLINDLLDFSRVGRVGGEVGEIDLAEVLAAVLDNLGAQIEDAEARVTSDPLPAVTGNRLLLGQLLQNLVGNAIKFRSQDPPRIHIAAVRRGDMWEFSCSDNGIGIDAKYADRIFLIFQRLHARDVYPGTGIGLALCKKIVEYHGGTIWVDPKPEHTPGTTFRWTLPASTAGPAPAEPATGPSAGGPQAADSPEDRRTRNDEAPQ